MGAFVTLRGWRKMSTAALWRALFNTGPGPDTGGENPGPSELDQMREKSGMDEALCVALLGAPTAGVASCPKAGVAAAAANNANKRKSRCLCIAQLPLVIAPSTSSRAPIAWLMTTLRYCKLPREDIRPPKPEWPAVILPRPELGGTGRAVDVGGKAAMT